MRLYSISCLTTALAAILTLSQPTLAQTIVYNNGTFGPLEGDSLSGSALADDFLVDSSLSFDRIRFYAIDAELGLLPSFSGTLSWFLYAGSSGTLPNAIPSTTILAQGTTSSVLLTDTGVRLGDPVDPAFEVAQLEFSVPTQNLSAGTYWLRLKEGTATEPSDGTNIYAMLTGMSPTGNPLRVDNDEVTPTLWENSESGDSDLSFQLLSSASTAPEPGTLFLLALGLVGGGLARRTRGALG